MIARYLFMEIAIKSNLSFSTVLNLKYETVAAEVDEKKNPFQFPGNRQCANGEKYIIKSIEPFSEVVRLVISSRLYHKEINEIRLVLIIRPIHLSALASTQTNKMLGTFFLYTLSPCHCVVGTFCNLLGYLIVI